MVTSFIFDYIAWLLLGYIDWLHLKDCRCTGCEFHLWFHSNGCNGELCKEMMVMVIIIVTIHYYHYHLQRRGVQTEDCNQQSSLLMMITVVVMVMIMIIIIITMIMITRVAEVGTLSAREKIATQVFIRRVFATFMTNASFLRGIANLPIQLSIM